jgi:hypothetical protein
MTYQEFETLLEKRVLVHTTTGGDYAIALALLKVAGELSDISNQLHEIDKSIQSS